MQENEGKFLCPIVGMYFRPPAKAILNSVPGGTKLRVRREPTNPYDANALAVDIHPKDIDERWDPRLTEECEFFGRDWNELREANEWIHLGYVKKEFAKSITEELNDRGSETSEFAGELRFNGAGVPQVAFKG